MATQKSNSFIADDKGSKAARQLLPDPKTTNEGPVAVVVREGIPYRFHLVTSGRSAAWKRVNAYGPQRCARQTCTTSFFLNGDDSVTALKRLYCSHSCRGRASEGRQISVRTAPFDAVAQTTAVAKGYVAPVKKVKKTSAASVSSAIQASRARQQTFSF